MASAAQRRADDRFLVTTAFLLADEVFFALALDLDELDERALALDLPLREERAEPAECDDLLRRPRAERERTCSGRFQPTARSARNELGMLRTPIRESVTASALTIPSRMCS